MQVQLLDLLLQCLADWGRWEEALGWCEAAIPVVPVKQQRPLSFWKVRRLLSSGIWNGLGRCCGAIKDLQTGTPPGPANKLRALLRLHMAAGMLDLCNKRSARAALHAEVTEQCLCRASDHCQGTRSTCLQVRALGKLGRSPEDEIARLRDTGGTHAAAAWLSLAQQESALELQRQYHEKVS